jgi:hypothetical protein
VGFRVLACGTIMWGEYPPFRLDLARMTRTQERTPPTNERPSGRAGMALGWGPRWVDAGRVERTQGSGPGGKPGPDHGLALGAGDGDCERHRHPVGYVGCPVSARNPAQHAVVAGFQIEGHGLLVGAAGCGQAGLPAGDDGALGAIRRPVLRLDLDVAPLADELVELALRVLTAPA